jgi:hypothetical protein
LEEKNVLQCEIYPLPKGRGLLSLRDKNVSEIISKRKK